MAHLTELLVLAAATAPVVAANVLLARHFASSTVGRVAVGLFTSTTQIVLTMQLLGAIGAWNSAAMLVAARAGSLLVGLLALSLAPGTDAAAPTDDGGETYPGWIKGLVVGSLVAVVVAGALAAVFGVDAGTDSNLYHRAITAGWSRSGSLWNFAALENKRAYLGAFWSNGEMFAMWTVVPLRGELLVQLCSLVWFAGTATAIFAAARELGTRLWTALVIVALLMLTPAIGGFQLGVLHIDLMVMQGMAIMIWAGLRWYRSDSSLRWLVLAGLGGGLAVGAKQSAIIFVGIFAAVLLIAALRHRRIGAAVLFVLAAIAPTVIWLVRAAVLTGNPFWPVGAGPLEGAEAFGPGAPTIINQIQMTGGQAIAITIIAPLLLYAAVVPLLALSAGPIWRYCREHRLVALGIVTPVVGWLLYFVTPMSGYSKLGIIVTQRYVAGSVAMFALIYGLARLAEDVPRFRGWRIATGVAVGIGFLSLVFVHSSGGFAWPMWAWAAGMLGGAIAVWVVLRRPTLSSAAARVGIGVGIAAALALVIAAPAARSANWYPIGSQVGPLMGDMAPAVEWHENAQIRDSNIAYTGALPQPFFGPDLTNDVYYVAEPLDDHGQGVFTDRTAWEDALQGTCTDYLVTMPDDSAGEWEWARNSEITDLIVGDDKVAVYAVAPGGSASCDLAHPLHASASTAIAGDATDGARTIALWALLPLAALAAVGLVVLAVSRWRKPIDDPAPTRPPAYEHPDAREHEAVGGGR